MKKIITAFLVFLMLLQTSAFASSYDANVMLELFVANGEKNGDGSFESPFGTIDEARDYIRNLKSNGQYPKNGVKVNLRGGKYFVDSTFELTEEDSGEENAPVIYQAYGLEDVSFVGGVEFPFSDFKDLTDSEDIAQFNSSVVKNIKYVNLNDYGITDYGKLEPRGWGVNQYYEFEGTPEMRQVADWMNFTPFSSSPDLFINGNTTTLARWPNNDGLDKITEIPEYGHQWAQWQWIEHYTGEYINGSTGEPLMDWDDVRGPTIKGTEDCTARIKKWAEDSEPWAYGYWKYEWADLASKIIINKDEGTFTLKHPTQLYNDNHAYDPNSTDVPANIGQGFYVYNIPYELDQEGEWYLERANGKLFYYPKKADNGQVLLTTMTDPFVTMTDVSNVMFRNINFNGHRSIAFEMTRCNDCTIELCDFTAIGYRGVVMSGDNRRNKFYSCYFGNIQSGAIMTSGGNSYSMEHSDNLIENCWFERYALDGNGYNCSFTLGGVGDTARHNRVNDCDGGGWAQGATETVTEYNEMYDTLRKMSDMGAVYAHQKFFDPGRVARHNYFHDIESINVKSHYIYMYYQDNASNGLSVYSNIFENCVADATMINGGSYNSVCNNIAINSQSLGVLTAFVYPSRKTAFESGAETYEEYYSGFFTRDVLTNPAWDKYSEYRTYLDETPYAPKDNTVKDNVCVNSGDFYLDTSSGYPESQMIERNNIEKSLKYSTDPGFENFSERNYILKEDSEIFKKIPDFEAPDFEKMGLYTPRLNMRLGESLAMLVNSNVACKGLENTMYIDENNRNVTPVIINDRTYLPIRFIGESVGGNVDFDNESFVATIELNGKTMTINATDGEIKVDGNILSEFTAVNKEGRLFVPVRALESMGEKVTWYDGGIVIVGDVSLEDTYNNGQEDNSLIDELIRRLK